MKSSAILFLWVLAVSDAFVPTCPRTGVLRQSSSSLYLTPGQGKQLVAASSTIYSDDEQRTSSSSSETNKSNNKTQKITLAHARDKIAKLFSLPASLWHPASEDTQDVVYFPIVGMYVHDQFVVPKTTNASCRLKPNDQEVFGWYSESCQLSCSDDEKYCQPPPNPTVRP